MFLMNLITYTDHKLLQVLIVCISLGEEGVVVLDTFLISHG